MINKGQNTVDKHVMMILLQHLAMLVLQVSGYGHWNGKNIYTTSLFAKFYFHESHSHQGKIDEIESTYLALTKRQTKYLVA